MNQDKQIELFYSFSRDVEESRDLLEGYRSDIDQLVSGYNLPSGVAVEVFHEEDMFADFKFLLLAAFILIFMILASVFESFVTPFVLLFSIPLAAIGSLLALLLTGNSLLNNANVMIGFLILLGVVVNNGIILIDYANILRRRGYRRNRALMTAGLSRIRPILITSITTIVAMLPMAMGNSEYAGAIGAPFAITVIGGLFCIVDADPDPYRLYGTGKHAAMVQGAVRESMGSARFALYGRSRLYLVLWWWPPVAVRLWGVVVGRYSGSDLFYADKSPPCPFEGDRSGDGHPYIRPQPGEDIRLAGTCQPPVEEWPADPSTVRFEEKLPYTCRIAG